VGTTAVLRLIPLILNEFYCCGDGHGGVADVAALKADVLVVAHLLEGVEAVDVVVGLAVLTGIATVQAAGDMDVLQVLGTGGHQGGIVA